MVSQISDIQMEVEYIYPLERIALIASKLKEHIVPLLNGFKDFYETLEVKPIDITTFKKNNYGKFNGKNRSQLGFWKRKNRFRGRDIEKFITNAYVKQLPQNDEEKIRKIIISHLNKLNEKKFTIIVKEFIDHLEEQMFFETFDILNNEILNKVANDNHYIYLYSKLVKELIINKKWQKKMFNIISGTNNDKEYYWSLNKLGHSHNDNEYVGPFENEQDALEDAMEHHNYKESFCSFMENKFNDRHLYQDEIKKTLDSFDLNIYAKNKYNNFLKLIFTSIEQGVFMIDLLHHVLLKLILSKEMEQFVYVYELINTNTKYKLNSESHNYYERKLNDVINQTSISPKIKFKLQELFKIKFNSTNMFEVLAVIDSPEKSDTISNSSPQDRDIECLISEFPINQDYKLAKDVFKSFKNDKYELFTSSIILSILEAKENERKNLFTLITKLIDDFSDYSSYFKTFIESNMINLFSEYELDFPKSKELFLDLINHWLKKGLVVKDKFIQQLKDKKSDDEDEQYNIDLFNEKIVVLL